jgi:NAD(P)-dependent dehydrogenase (short-subunit alcohol dehydrogenase family)
MLATYSGSKAFLSTFTSALAEEVRGHNITVEHVNTYFVVSIRYYALYGDQSRSHPGIQAVEDPKGISADPAAWRLRALCFIQGGACLWCWIQWEAGDVDAILVAWVVGLRADADRVASGVYQV